MPRLNLTKTLKTKGLSKIKKQAWDLFSLWVRQRDADHRGMNTCVSCGKVAPWKELQAGHFVPKSRGLVFYFEERNVHPQCERCNIWDKENAKIRYTIFMQKKYGPQIVEELEALSQTNFKMYRSDYEELIEKLKSRLSVIARSGKWFHEKQSGAALKALGEEV